MLYGGFYHEKQWGQLLSCLWLALGVLNHILALVGVSGISVLVAGFRFFVQSSLFELCLDDEGPLVG